MWTVLYCGRTACAGAANSVPADNMDVEPELQFRRTMYVEPEL
jgi:hypothetical protein